MNIVGTKLFYMVHFYEMPHNNCSFGMILGLHDMKGIGYGLGVRISEDTIIWEHKKGSEGKLDYIESSTAIMNKFQDQGKVFSMFQERRLPPQQYVQHKQYDYDEEEELNHEDEKEDNDGRSLSHGDN